MKLTEQQMDLQKGGQKLIDPKLLRLGWVAKLVARLLATVALWVRIQTSLKYAKWAT
jgi:hypothetical protein